MIIFDIINIIIISTPNLSGGVAPCSAPLSHQVWPRGQKNPGFERLGKEEAKGGGWRKGARVRKLFPFLRVNGEVRSDFPTHTRESVGARRGWTVWPITFPGKWA